MKKLSNTEVNLKKEKKCDIVIKRANLLCQNESLSKEYFSVNQNKIKKLWHRICS